MEYLKSLWSSSTIFRQQRRSSFPALRRSDSFTNESREPLALSSPVSPMASDRGDNGVLELETRISTSSGVVLPYGSSRTGLVADVALLESFREEIEDEDTLQRRKGYATDSFLGQCQYILSTFWLGQVAAYHYLVAETKRNLRGFFIGLFTVLLIVMFVAVLNSATSKAPYIFFRIAETSVGETDLLITPGVQSADESGTFVSLPLVNQTYIDAGIASHPELNLIEGSSNRWLLVAKVVNPAHANDSRYEASTVALGQNTLKERAIGIGRTWDYPPLAANHVYMSRTIARQIGWSTDPVSVIGETLILRLDIFDLAVTLNLIDDSGSGTYQEATPAQVKQLIDRFSPVPINWNQTVNPAIFNFTSPNRTKEEETAIVRAVVHSILTSDATLKEEVELLHLNLALPPEIADLTFREALDLYNKRAGTHITLEQVESIIVSQVMNTDDIPIDENGDLNPLIALLKARAGTLTYSDLVVLSMPLIRQLARMDHNVTVADIVDDPDGKWASALGSVTMMENDDFVHIFTSGILDKMNQTIDQIDLGSVIINGTNLGSITIHLNRSISISSLISDGNQTVIKEFENSLNSIDGDSSGVLSIVQYKDRLSAYIKDLDTLNAELQQFTNEVGETMDIDYPATFTVPLAVALKNTMFIRYFLDSVFNSVIAVVVLLGILLIYSLLLNDAESKTYEYGMLRALGMKQRMLIQILTTKAALFAVPGIGIGLLLAFLINIPVAQFLSGYAAIPTNYELATAGIITAVFLGTFMPFIANVLPIQRALSRTLRDSLDVYHHVISTVTVRMIKLQDLGLDLWQTAVALLMVIVGFLTFYVIPYAFTFKDYPLFLGVLNAILMGMLLGLCVMASTVQPHLEVLVARVMLLFHHRQLYPIVRKNLGGHKQRNSKTGQMFTICLGFLIFAGAMFSLQSESLADNLRVFIGADLSIQANARDFNNALSEKEMSEYLDQIINRRLDGDPNAVVESYAFVTYNLAYFETVDYLRFSNLAQFPLMRQQVYGVPENYMDVIYSDYIHYSETNVPSSAPHTSSGNVDAIRSGLYQDAGRAVIDGETGIPTTVGSGYYNPSLAHLLNQTAEQLALNQDYEQYIDVIVGESIHGPASVTVSTPLVLYMEYYDSGYHLYGLHYLCKARAMVIKLPGFLYSSYEQTATLASVVMSMPQYQRILNSLYPNLHGATAPDPVPKQKLLIRCVKGATEDQRNDVVNGLRTYFNSDRVNVFDTNSLIESTAVATKYMNLFFVIVGSICMILCFFILWISFYANVRENAWEFGVLRSLGVNSVQVICIYIYEALAVVISSIILGTIIGLLIAISLIIQFNLFTELPFRMLFPTTLFLVMALLSLFIAVIGSAIPAWGFMKRSISTVLRLQ